MVVTGVLAVQVPKGQEEGEEVVTIIHSQTVVVS